MPEERGVSLGRCVEIGDFLFGNEENVSRCFWRGVAEGQTVIVFIDEVGGDFAVDDAFEDGFGHRRVR